MAANVADQGIQHLVGTCGSRHISRRVHEGMYEQDKRPRKSNGNFAANIVYTAPYKRRIPIHTARSPPIFETPPPGVGHPYRHPIGLHRSTVGRRTTLHVTRTQ